MEHESVGEPIVTGVLRTNSKVFKEAGRVENRRTNRDHLNYNRIKIDQNTEKSPGDKKTCCYSDSSEKPLANAGVKNSQEIIIENETHYILWDFELQMNHLFPALRPDLVIINKKKITCQLVYFVIPAHHSEN